ncbi:hypothetical protein LIER_28846 [Lithospermum erythrorhizon]|uniref:Uncharacterized protein n=1 Tax=Lithospermum erythrorhizon TaxID=34254 RepID=A0AAV3RLD9_LITER
MVSLEGSFDAWEEVQRHGHDLAGRLSEGFSGLIQSTQIHPPSFHWPAPPKTSFFEMDFPAPNFVKADFLPVIDKSGLNGVFDIGNRIMDFPAPNFVKADFLPIIDKSGLNGVFNIGNRIGQAGADLGASLNGVVQQFLRRLPGPFKQDESSGSVDSGTHRNEMSLAIWKDLGTLAERLRDYGYTDTDMGKDRNDEEEMFGVKLKTLKHFGKALGTINVTSTYSSRTQNVESSLVARGDLWRVETSNERSTTGNENSSLFLLQLGPVLFVRDSTLLLPVHLSNKHLLWYGYDRKSGMHSLCPAVWSKHRRWLLMSMICINPLACSFMDLQFPNGQITYVSGEGLSTSAYFPAFGGLLQVHGQYPGEMKFSFSCKNKWGTSVTPVVQWPDKSFTLDLSQALAWKRSGLMVRPTIQIGLSPTFGGSDPGLRAELTHSLKEEINLICGCALARYPSAFTAVSLGRSRWNGNVGSAGVVLKFETPVGNVGNPSFSVQLNGGFEL